MADEKKKSEGKQKRPTAKKREIQNEKRRVRNAAFKSSMRTAVRSFEEALQQGEKASVQTRLNEVYSVMDGGVKRGLCKLNKASRTKARLTLRSLALA